MAPSTPSASHVKYGYAANANAGFIRGAKAGHGYGRGGQYGYGGYGQGYGYGQQQRW